MKRICVLGYARHGKDTFCDYITKKLNLKFKNASDVANELIVFSRLKDKYGYKTLEECYDDRVNHRKEWFNIIREYICHDKSMLTREIQKHSDIVVGIRDITEFIASKPFFDIVIWIDASKRLPIEDISSCTIIPALADVIIENNGTEEEFYHNIDICFENQNFN